jgi:hypothetical protein
VRGMKGGESIDDIGVDLAQVPGVRSVLDHDSSSL